MFTPRFFGVLALGVAVVVVIAVFVAGGGNGGHTVYVTIPKATGVLKGQLVRAGGSDVGSVSDLKAVQGGRAARLTLTIDDDAWPLTKGSSFLVRWAGTINQYNRYISLTRGPDTAPPMVSDGGTLPASALKTPVEYGDLLNVFDKPTRAGLRKFLDNGGAALNDSGPELHRAFAVAPAALQQADQVLRDLNASQTDLHNLVVSTSDVIGAIQRANPGLGELVQGAGDTLSATAAEATNLQATIGKAPATFTNIRDTLHRADPTLANARTLLSDLGPGVSELRTISSPLNRLFVTLTQVGPDARATLQTLATAAPGLTRFVDRTTQLMPRIKSVSTQVAPELGCIVPYVPDIAAFGSDWGSSLASRDSRDKYIRANVEGFLPSLSNNRFDTSADAVRDSPGLRVAFPRPPGYMAGQPYFLPKCHITKDSLDATKDPEARPYNSVEQLPALVGTGNP